MPQVKLNKSSLSLEQKNLKLYKQFVPSLDMKRRKLLLEKNKSYLELEKIEKIIKEKENNVASHFPMIANDAFNIDHYIKVKDIQLKNENTVGTILPVIENIDFSIKKYDLFNSPPWLDNFINKAKELIEMKIRLNIAKMRIQLLDKSLKIVTQRKNLFEKVLIPKTITTIRYIQIFLADNERAAVVRSKLAKKKREETIK